MNWPSFVFGCVPLGIGLAVRAFLRRRRDAPVSSQQGLWRSPALLPKPEHRRRDTGARKKGTPGISWHCAIKPYIGQRMGAFVAREAPEPQPIQQVPPRTRRQLSQGVGREGFYDYNRDGRETLLKEQAER
jgi:hypothetical protein